MTQYKKLQHSQWECKYHIVFIPKYRRKVLFGTMRQHLGEVFRRLARQKESEIEEGHLMPDHVHMMISIPPKYAVAQVVGYIKGKSAIHIARHLCAGKSRRGERVKVLNSEGRASHAGPESCAAAREDRGEALTGEGTGRVFSREIHALGRESEAFRGADAVSVCGRQDRMRRQGQTHADPARSETPCTHRITSRGSREISRSSVGKVSADRIGKS